MLHVQEILVFKYLIDRCEYIDDITNAKDQEVTISLLNQNITQSYY